MDDTEKPDPILMQVPLIRNPSYQPPKAITLNLNYNKLLPTLTTSVVPPKVSLSAEELKKWAQEIESLKQDKFSESKDAETVEKFQDWVKGKQTKVAPGFDSSGGVMTPTRIERSETEIKADSIDKSSVDAVNELDVVFGKTTI